MQIKKHIEDETSRQLNDNIKTTQHTLKLHIDLSSHFLLDILFNSICTDHIISDIEILKNSKRSRHKMCDTMNIDIEVKKFLKDRRKKVATILKLLSLEKKYYMIFSK